MPWSLFGSLTNIVEGVGDAIDDVSTGAANAVSTTVSLARNGLSDMADDVGDMTSDIPVVGGVVDAVATVVDGTTAAGEIVAHHFMMMVAESGQAVGTVLGTAANAAEAVTNLDLECALHIVKDGVGEIIVTDQQYVAAHLAHDVELVQIPIAMVSEGMSEILAGVIGENFASNAPYLADGAQSLVIDAGLYESVIVPMLDGWADANDTVFGDVGEDLSPADMGMGYVMEDMDGMDMADADADPGVLSQLSTDMLDGDSFLFA